MERRALLEVIIFTMAAVVFTILGFLFPVVGSFLLLLTPLPFIVLAARWSSILSIIAVIISAVILVLLVNPALLLLIIFFSGLIGVSMGAAFEEEFSPQVVLVVGAGAVLFSLLINLGVSLYIFNLDVVDQMTESIRAGLVVYQDLGISQEVIDQLITELVKLISNTYPVLFLSVGMLVAGLNYYFSSKLLNKIAGYDYPPLFFLKNFKLPRLAAVIYILSFLFSGAIWQNIYVLGTFLFIVEGGAAAYYYFKEKSGGKIILLAGILFFALTLQILLFVGIIDVLFDFRKIEEKD